MSISTEISRITTLRTSIASKLSDLGMRVLSGTGTITEYQSIFVDDGFGLLQNCNTQYFTAGEQLHIALNTNSGYSAFFDPVTILHDDIGDYDYCQAQNQDVRIYFSNQQTGYGELLVRLFHSYDGGATYEVYPSDEVYIRIEYYDYTAPSTLSDCYSVLSSVTGLPATSYTPTTFVQTISAGQYLSGAQTINAIAGTITLSSNGTFNIASYSRANVNVATQDSRENEIINRTISGTYENGVVTKIGVYGFAQCTKLTSVAFPLVTSLSTYAFYYCTSLTSVSFPSLTYVGSSAFMYCSKLSEISFSLATTVADNAFNKCYNLTSAYLPVCQLVTSSAFINCSKLKSIDLPGCTYAGVQAFMSCYELSMASFKVLSAFKFSSTFAYCSNLISLFLFRSSVCQLSKTVYQIFGNSPVSTTNMYAWRLASIYVPSSLLTSYKAATNWTTVSSKIFAYESFFGTIGSFGYVNPSWTPAFSQTLYADVASRNGYYIDQYVGDIGLGDLPSHCIAIFDDVTYPLATHHSTLNQFGAPLSGTSHKWDYYPFYFDTEGDIYIKESGSHTLTIYDQLP